MLHAYAHLNTHVLAHICVCTHTHIYLQEYLYTFAQRFSLRKQHKQGCTITCHQNVEVESTQKSCPSCSCFGELHSPVLQAPPGDTSCGRDPERNLPALLSSLYGKFATFPTHQWPVTAASQGSLPQQSLPQFPARIKYMMWSDQGIQLKDAGSSDGI